MPADALPIAEPASGPYPGYVPYTRRPVALVELQDGRPFSVWLWCERFQCFDLLDFEWSERDGRLYWWDVGSPRTLYVEQAENPYWLAEGYPVPEGADPAKRIAALPEPYRIETLITDTDESDCSWCERCRSMVAHEQPCPHVWFCERCQAWSSPDERRNANGVYRCAHNRLNSQADYQPPGSH